MICSLLNGSFSFSLFLFFPAGVAAAVALWDANASGRLPLGTQLLTHLLKVMQLAYAERPVTVTPAPAPAVLPVVPAFSPDEEVVDMLVGGMGFPSDQVRCIAPKIPLISWGDLLG